MGIQVNMLPGHKRKAGVFQTWCFPIYFPAFLPLCKRPVDREAPLWVFSLQWIHALCMQNEMLTSAFIETPLLFSISGWIRFCLILKFLSPLSEFSVVIVSAGVGIGAFLDLLGLSSVSTFTCFFIFLTDGTQVYLASFQWHKCGFICRAASKCTFHRVIEVTAHRSWWGNRAQSLTRCHVLCVIGFERIHSYKATGRDPCKSDLPPHVTSCDLRDAAFYFKLRIRGGFNKELLFYLCL